VDVCGVDRYHSRMLGTSIDLQFFDNHGVTAENDWAKSSAFRA
jgi:hypothetical protein